ncbi:MAG: tetratricopeptide repeat protein [Thermodesulfovibrionia bacterium]
MAKLTVFIVIVFLIVLSLLAFFNKHSVELTVWQGVTYEIPVVALILISAAIGTFSVFITVAIRDARRYIENWREQRQHKKALRIQELYSKGMNAFFASRYDEAEDFFNKILNEEPNHTNALLRIGDIYFNKNDLSKAREYYTKAIEIEPRNIEIIFSLERLSETQERWQEALRYLDNILEIDDDNPKALYKKRDILDRNKRWEELLDVQNMIIKSDISVDEKKTEEERLNFYRYELGAYYMEHGDTERAIKILRSIMKADKDFIPAYITLADAYLKEGNTEEAEDVLRKGLAETSSLVILVRLEDHLMAMGEPDRAIESYQRAIQLAPQDMRLYFFLAKLYYRLEMIDHAFETAISIDTTAFDPRDLHILLGSIYERRIQYEKSTEEFKKALKVDKQSFIIPFTCGNCGYKTMEWAGRCPNCREWNTFTLST